MFKFQDFCNGLIVASVVAAMIFFGWLMVDSTKETNKRNEEIGHLVIDQCIRERLFKECLQNLPVGPTHVVSNDWDDIVDSCATNAARTAYRRIENVPMQCR